MPEKRTLQRAKRDKRQGKSSATQAGEFVREEVHHVREGKHGARSTKQAIAIGLSKARRAGVKLPPQGASGSPGRKSAPSDLETPAAGSKPSPRRSRGVRQALQREGRSAASRTNLSRQAKSASRRRSPAERSAAARKAARTRRRTSS